VTFACLVSALAWSATAHAKAMHPSTGGWRGAGHKIAAPSVVGGGVWFSRIAASDTRLYAVQPRVPGDSWTFQPPVVAAGPELRYAVFVAGALYCGAAGGLAFGHARSEGADDAVTAVDGLNFWHARVGPLLGVSSPIGSSLSVRGEVLVAYQAMRARHRERSTGAVWLERTAINASFAAEARVAIDWWLTPNATLSMWAGIDVVRFGNQSAGVAAAWHFQSWDESH